MNNRKSMDIFEKYLADVAENRTEVRTGLSQHKEHKGLSVVEASQNQSTLEEWTGLGGRRGYQRGTVVNYVEVLGPHVRQGRAAKYSNRKYKVVCIAPTGPKGQPCGKSGVVTYHQLYYETIYSCGCLKRPKHPPVRLEGQQIGRVEVLRWTEEHGGMWEMVCHECGELLYRKTVHQVRAAGKSCDSHGRAVA